LIMTLDQLIWVPLVLGLIQLFGHTKRKVP
jgi:hypothetical protein